MTTIVRRVLLALVIMGAAAACTPQEMTAWLEAHDRPVPESEDDLAALADWSTAYWQSVLDQLAAATARDAQTSGFGWPWDQLSWCESSGNWAINTGNGYYGGLQFAHSTWVAYGGQAYAAYAYQARPWQQIAIAQKVVASHGGSYRAWPGCRASLGLP